MNLTTTTKKTAKCYYIGTKLAFFFVNGKPIPISFGRCGKIVTNMIFREMIEAQEKTWLIGISDFQYAE